MKERPPCLAPWKVLSLKPGGGVVPDAQYVGQYGNLKREGLDELWSSQEARTLRREHRQGERPASCRNCWRKESSIGHSRRIFFNDILAGVSFNEDFSELAEPDIVYLDVNLSNACNLKCRMCNGVISSFWRTEEQALQSLGTRLYVRPELKEKTKLKAVSVESLLKEKKHFKNLRYLALRGGEPFLEKENEKVLDALIEWGLAPQVTVDISTNGSIYSESLFQRLNQFRSTDLYVSLEGVGDLYQYIRGGREFGLHDLESNIRKFRRQPRVRIMYAVTVSIYNILSLGSIWSWFASFRENGEELYMTNIVVNPEYLNYQILPRTIKEKALERLRQAQIPKGPWFSGHREVGDIGSTLIERHLTQEIYTRTQKRNLLDQFKQFNSDLDQLRGVSLKEVCSDLSKLYDPLELERQLSLEREE